MGGDLVSLLNISDSDPGIRSRPKPCAVATCHCVVRAVSSTASTDARAPPGMNSRRKTRRAWLMTEPGGGQSTASGGQTRREGARGQNVVNEACVSVRAGRRVGVIVW